VKCPATIRIGTRASNLAIAQAKEVKNRLLGAFPDLTQAQIEIVQFITTGDRIQDRHLADIGGKGLFTKEIEEALFAGTVDIAVHSMKDMPDTLPEGLVIPCILEREDSRDCLIGKYKTIADIPQNAVIGTSSLRRQSQLLRIRPDLKVVQFRGNVNTRLRKLAEGVVDASILAVAGLHRLELNNEISYIFSEEEMLPAVAQGAIGVECRADNIHILAVLERINHTTSFTEIACERAYLKELGGSCQTPIAGRATISGSVISFKGRVLSDDGAKCYEVEGSADISEAHLLGKEMGKKMVGYGCL
jgi:hydroxymethylbilane synthase